MISTFVLVHVTWIGSLEEQWLNSLVMMSSLIDFSGSGQSFALSIGRGDYCYSQTTQIIPSPKVKLKRQFYY